MLLKFESLTRCKKLQNTSTMYQEIIWGSIHLKKYMKYLYLKDLFAYLYNPIQGILFNWWYVTLGCFIITKVVQSFLCDGCIFKDIRNIFFLVFRHCLGVPQGGSTLRKVDFQVTPIALLSKVVSQDTWPSQKGISSIRSLRAEKTTKMWWTKHSKIVEIGPHFTRFLRTGWSDWGSGVLRYKFRHRKTGQSE